MLRKLLILSLFFHCLWSYAQELPPVLNFSPNNYNAGNQNWMVAQAGNQNFYFANSTGLLEYDGENWSLYPVPNNTIVRSVKAVGERVYTGAYMEVGYWEPTEFGKLEYTSLLPLFRDKLNDGEQIWDIEELDGKLVFRSFAGIYFYDPQKEEVTQMENPIGKPVSGIFRLKNELYFQLVEAGLFKISNGEPRLVIPNSELGERTIVHLFEKRGKLNFVSGNSEFFNWDGKRLTPVFEQLSAKIGKPNLLSAIQTAFGELILGTVGSGILQIDNNGEIIHHFDQGNILLNNTVLDLFADDQGNIWAGLDYGISTIDAGSSYRSFQDNQGEIGSVYASFNKDAELYLGTNQGLYYKPSPNAKFQLVEGTKGQVWFIDEIDGRLFCGHDNGTYLIEGNQARKLCDRLGTWLVKRLKNNVYIQGHYNGISFLRYQNAEFEPLPMLEDFPHSSKFIELRNGEVWVSNEHKGVFKMNLADSLSHSPKITKIYEFERESGVTSSFFQFQDSLYYSSSKAVYRYDEVRDSFTRNSEFNKLTKDLKKVSGKMMVAGERVWGFAEEGIFSIQPGNLSREYNLEFIFIGRDYRNIAKGYENITKIGDEEYLIGVANGYMKFNLPIQTRELNDLRITGIAKSSLDSAAVPVSYRQPGEFSHEHNNLYFQFSLPAYSKYKKAEYSYRLLGLSPNWSEWAPGAEASFNNLDFGDYRFELKARLGKLTSPVVSYDFSIERPFYLSNLAIVLYVIGLVLLGFLVHFLYRYYHRKQIAENERKLKMKNLEAEREIIKLQNEKLEQDMANKNRELAVSTMSLIKKNEFLTSIKDQLRKSEASGKVKSVIKTIDRDINEEDNWNFFKKAFSNADKDFFKKVKARHPELTANDLKLCAYLRLNLSSKEIAPLLNISVKSVEIKRYRLRKKMNLDRDTNLTEYILAL